METPLQKLMDMAAVHAFYVGLLEDRLGHPVPVPHEVDTPGKDVVGKSVDALAHWLNLLDLAITAPMVRDGLKETTSPDTAEALLRYFIRKQSHSDADRDKADFVVTFLYRNTVAADKQIVDHMDVDVPSEFEEEIYTMLGSEEVVQLPEEHRQLVREFPFVRDEVDDFRHFDQLMDSGVVQRVRELKQRLGTSFYHPRVLATIAQYNVYFGHRFDQLFRETAQQIKQFAATVQEQGGSISTRVDGDVTVKHLAEVEEGTILKTEYGKAQEHFRKISQFKKAVDSRTGRTAAAAATGVARPAPVGPHSGGAAGAAPALAASVPTSDHLETGINPALEQGKLRTMEDSIRNFVLAADPKAANIVPLRTGNLSLTNAEVEAFRAQYTGEKSFRADYAGALRQAIAIYARLNDEIQAYLSKKTSAYLWKPHADALTWLMTAAQKLQDQSADILRTAEQRGLTEKATALNGALQKVRAQVQSAAKALQG